jgi:hypothetical protein
MPMDIPKDPNYPFDAVQCDGCGGHGCEKCKQRGWFTMANGWTRRCWRDACRKPLHPAELAIYCSVACALADAGVLLMNGHP